MLIALNVLKTRKSKDAPAKGAGLSVMALVDTRTGQAIK
jgi:hypothetical protein